ncbi:F0F1 ATP synthase subunit A [Francisellaceae bacterium CB299]|jgi:F-type H+-transporting ATPase subunit a
MANTEAGAQVATNYVQHHLHHWQVSLGDGAFWKLNVDSLLVSSILGGLFVLIMFLVARKASSDVPGKFQNIIEAIWEWMDGLVSENYHFNRNFVTPLALTIFVWVVLMNLMDLLPVDLFGWVISFFTNSHEAYFRSVPTADPNVTFAMSFTVFFLVIFYNIKAKGFGLFSEILTAPFVSKNIVFKIVLAPLNIFFRVIDEVVKPISLSLRLFGNIFAGELIFILIALLYASGMIAGSAGVVLGSIWAIFHILIVLIQAFVFMMLTVVYLNMAQEAH